MGCLMIWIDAEQATEPLVRRFVISISERREGAREQHAGIAGEIRVPLEPALRGLVVAFEGQQTAHLCADHRLGLVELDRTIEQPPALAARFLLVFGRLRGLLGLAEVIRSPLRQLARREANPITIVAPLLR